MPEKKKIAFYSILSSGHLNVCSNIGTVLLDNHGDKVDVYFIVDNVWKEKLSKNDSRFKFGSFDYDNPENGTHLTEMVAELEKCLTMSNLDKLAVIFQAFMRNETLIEVDTKSEIEIKKIKPDFLICDQGCHLPAMVNSGVPYAFLASCNPLIFSIPGFPVMGCDARVDEKDKIDEFNEKFLPEKIKVKNRVLDIFKIRGVEFKANHLSPDEIRSDCWSIYTYPQEVDYFDEEIRKKFRLWQIDTPLYHKRIPKPFELPKKFFELPGKIIYVSLGSLFSSYTHLLQRIVNILDKLDHKYIVSKGPNGDKLIFPSNKFIGENYVNQLAVLQVSDMMIAHGGNNTFGECFYMGVPCIIMPVIADQINNGKRIEETGYGYQLDIINYKDEELIDKINKILNDEELKKKWKDASERIQKENRIEIVADKLVDYVTKL